MPRETNTLCCIEAEQILYTLCECQNLNKTCILNNWCVCEHETEHYNLVIAGSTSTSKAVFTEDILTTAASAASPVSPNTF